jgi:hypothetical protein
MHKTLIALNKEKTAWTGSSGNGGGRWNRLLNSGIGVTFSSQWWLNHTAKNLGRLIN